MYFARAEVRADKSEHLNGPGTSPLWEPIENPPVADAFVFRVQGGLREELPGDSIPFMYHSDLDGM